MASNTEQIIVKKLQEFSGHRAAVYSLAWDEQLGLISGGGDGWIAHWSLDESATGNLLAKIEARIFSMAATSKVFLAGTMKGDLIFLDRAAAQWKARVIIAHDKGIFSICTFDGFFLTAGGDGYVCKWDWEGNQLDRKRIAPNTIRSMVLHPNEKILALATSAGHIYFIHPETLEAVIPPYLMAHDPSVFTCLWNPGGDQLISGGRDALLKIWSYPDFEPVPKEIKAHLYTINAMAAHPNKNLLATASRDRTIKIWDKTTFALLKVIDLIKYGGHTASVNTLIWNQAGLFSGGDDKKVMQWDIDLTTINTKTDS